MRVQHVRDFAVVDLRMKVLMVLTVGLLWIVQGVVRGLVESKLEASQPYPVDGIVRMDAANVTQSFCANRLLAPGVLMLRAGGNHVMRLPTPVLAVGRSMRRQRIAVGAGRISGRRFQVGGQLGGWYHDRLIGGRVSPRACLIAVKLD